MVRARPQAGRATFAGEDDRRLFVDRLGRDSVPDVLDLLTWALLLNQFHPVIRLTDVAPATLSLRLNTPTARRERRRGAKE